MTELPELAAGLTATIQYRVKDASTARQVGSGSVDVLATPELVRLMEVAAVMALAEHLPPEYTSVGVSLDITHVAPTPVGLGVQVSATLVEVQGRRLRFEVVAYDDVEEVGRGSHERVLVEIEGFTDRAKRKLG